MLDFLQHEFLRITERNTQTLKLQFNQSHKTVSDEDCLKARPKSANQEQRIISPEFFRSSWNLAPYMRDPLMES